MNPHRFKNIFLLIALLSFFGILLFWLYMHSPIAAEQKEVVLSPATASFEQSAKKLKIIALGASLTEGVGASSPEKSFVGVLEHRLNITIQNKGVGGETTSDVLKRLDTEVLIEHPDIVIVVLGGNDYLSRVPKEEAFHNLESIIKRIQENGAHVILVTLSGGELGDRFKTDFALVAQKTGALLVPDALDAVFGNPEHMSKDGIHPNDSGYALIADKIAPTLQNLINTLTAK